MDIDQSVEATDWARICGYPAKKKPHFCDSSSGYAFSLGKDYFG